MWEEYGYAGLFAVSFGAATVFPISSEVVFVALIAAGFDPWGCVWAASVGNWLGGMTTYGLGRMGKTDWLLKYGKISAKRLKKIQDFVAAKGAVVAFFGFLPAIGDVIVFMLGLLRANFGIASLSMYAGKLMRYCLLSYGVLEGIEWLKHI